MVVLVRFRIGFRHGVVLSKFETQHVDLSEETSQTSIDGRKGLHNYETDLFAFDRYDHVEENFPSNIDDACFLILGKRRACTWLAAS